MSRGRDLVRMSEAEVEAFLDASKKVQVATNNPDGSPHLTTLFHVVQDGRIAFWTYGRSQKIKNLERDSRITCLVEAGDDYFELRGVSVTGRAEVLREPAAVRAVGEAVACRMLGVEDVDALGEAGRDEVERQVAKRVAVVVHPERVASWDHAKLLSR